jgi:hypothetical protein
MNRCRLADCGRRAGPFFTRRHDDNTTPKNLGSCLRPSLETAHLKTDPPPAGFTRRLAGGDAAEVSISRTRTCTNTGRRSVGTSATARS